MMNDERNEMSPARFIIPRSSFILSLHRLSLPLMLLQRRRLDGGCGAFRGFHQSARGVLLSQIQEPFLASHQRLAALGCDLPEAAVRMQFPSLDVVRQTHRQDLLDEPLL